MSATGSPPPTTPTPKATALPDGSATDFESPHQQLETGVSTSYRDGLLGSQNNQNPPPEEHPQPLWFSLGQRIRGLFNPNITDFQRLLKQLEDQCHMLDVADERYYSNSSMIGMENEDKKEDPREDPNHPINTAKFNSNLITDVQFAGRGATDPSIIKLSTLLINHDNFGCIIEIWLNDNQISDEGSSAIASYLERPSCPLVELWLGRNQIGPLGAVDIAAALTNNVENSKMKCLGLYLNPIGNKGAMALATMLRKNHTLTTVDVHGCLYYDKKRKNPKKLDDGPGITELYGGGCGCKAITPYDGNEYIAQVINNDSDREVKGAGFVTDVRYMDAIQSFSAFNRMNPTREKAIHGFMPSKGQGASVVSSDADNKEEQSEIMLTSFLSELRGQPGNEHLTGDEKIQW
eukprot:CAMPEP_0172320422 /NCGR_PEP_ID=MMETSP1058-20130122/40545_1 /TAXON_ID=83371 /ORGANISM="Detonula confervacea, Strain CCMP 353" /LENGTH=405 /DNA_ID=CAMNT_0013035691 /DNA_START=6 /DNA_END=1220 /DNA_ORIENTATION=+